MVPREIKDNGYAIFFLVVELRGGGGGGWTNKVYNGLSCFVLPFAMPRE